ncbi:MAG: hypothetical protein ACRDZR_12700 [Acidimicrobiales bacterium]
MTALVTRLRETSWVFGGSTLHRLRRTPAPRIASAVLDHAAHAASRAETWALDLQARVGGVSAGRPLSPEATRLVEGHPRAYTFRPNSFATPERRHDIEQALKDVLSA